MKITAVKNFTFPIFLRKGIISIIMGSISQKATPVVLGRWNLKHEDKELNKFYKNIPDPGYPNIYPKSMNAGYEPLYNRSGKRQS